MAEKLITCDSLGRGESCSVARQIYNQLPYKETMYYTVWGCIASCIYMYIPHIHSKIILLCSIEQLWSSIPPVVMNIHDTRIYNNIILYTPKTSYLPRSNLVAIESFVAS